MSEEKKETLVQHKWLWAISPIDAGRIAFVAHCRVCDQIFIVTKYAALNPSISKVGLPEWGCVIPSGF